MPNLFNNQDQEGLNIRQVFLKFLSQDEKELIYETPAVMEQ